jgi:hypothetical protein
VVHALLDPRVRLTDGCRGGSIAEAQLIEHRRGFRRRAVPHRASSPASRSSADCPCGGVRAVDHDTTRRSRIYCTHCPARRPHTGSALDDPGATSGRVSSTARANRPRVRSSGSSLPFVIGRSSVSSPGYFGGWIDTVTNCSRQYRRRISAYVLVIALVFAPGPGRGASTSRSRSWAGCRMRGSCVGR